MVTVIFGGAALAPAALLVAEVWLGSPYFILWSLCSIYVMLCLRAALLAPRDLAEELSIKEILPSWIKVDV
jgi:hypothetical protein